MFQNNVNPMAQQMPQFNPNPLPQMYPQFNPYMQQYQRPMQAKELNGRFITEGEPVMPKDIPDDGTVAFFPLKDYSKIVAKAWKPDGTIEEVVYFPEKAQSKPDVQQVILNKLNAHDEMLTKIMGLLGKGGEQNV